MSRPALFLDRDGTLIHDTGYPRDPELVVLLPGAVAALRAASAAGWALVIVSNQSGVARGLVTADEARRVQARVEALFAAEGVTFDGARFCFHGPADACECRKPEPGMILTAARELDLDLRSSVMIGDKPSDAQAGRAAGCKTIVLGGVPVPEADARCAAWSEVAASLIRIFPQQC
jgi:D-glycero-D-manno-heptose 1,7-bisphosphate phosphatase